MEIRELASCMYDWLLLWGSLVPRPRPKNWERGLVLLANFPVCAESGCYVTIACLTWSRCSQLLMALQSRWTDLATERLQTNPVLYPKQRQLTQHIREYLQVTPGSFPNFWVGAGDEATLIYCSRKNRLPPMSAFTKETYLYAVIHHFR